MKKLVVLGMMLMASILVGCGNNNDTENDTASADAGIETDDTRLSEDGFPEESESMKHPVEVLATYFYEANAAGETDNYDVSNDSQFWSNVYALLCEDGELSPALENKNESISGDAISISGEYVKEFASALYAGYDITEDLPDMSASADASGTDSLIGYDLNHDMVSYVTTNQDKEISIVYGSCVQTETDVYEFEVTMNSSDGQELAQYTFTMVPSTYDSEESLYEYSISNVVINYMRDGDSTGSDETTDSSTNSKTTLSKGDISADPVR